MLRATCVLFLNLVSSVPTTMDGFIGGGRFANIAHHAHSVFLNVNCQSVGGKIVYICGGSVVNQKIVLTAAHCLHGCTAQSYIRIHVGNEHRQRGQTYTTFSFVLHEDYDYRSSINDLCLIRVGNQILLNKKTTRVALMRHPPYNENATVAGWGMVDENSQEQSAWLKFVSQRVLSRKDCLRVYTVLPQGTICATSFNTKDYATHGDSGSALIVRGYIQVGLVSYKVPSASNYIVIYTDIGYFYEWIKTYSKRLACI